MRPNSTVVVVDFDGSSAPVTACALRRAGGGAISIVMHEELSLQLLRSIQPSAVCLAASDLGAIYSVPTDIFSIDLPFLGICNGAQLIAEAHGACIQEMNSAENGVVSMSRGKLGVLSVGTRRNQDVYMHHEYRILGLPTEFRVTGSTSLSPIAAFEFLGRPPLFGAQFHPESEQTRYGDLMLRRFVRFTRIYNSSTSWRRSRML